METIESINNELNQFVWGPGMLFCFLAIGLMYTIRTRVFQITGFRHWIGATLFAVFKDKRVLKTDDKHAISQFQSLCTALAATIGTGNIAGVATAIVAGGPGAIFWMWISAFSGMMTNFAEKTLGIQYRYKNAKGDWIGGAMIYIERGLGCKWLAVVFSVFCALASFGIGNMAQANSVANGLEHNFAISPSTTAIFTMLFVSMVIVGGIKRIAGVTEKLVPFMALFYMVGAFVVIGINIEKVPEAFAMIFREAFRVKAVGGGVLGYGMAAAMRIGISRGVFSNEAGLGSSVMAHSASDVKEPVVQGMWGMFEVFADTLVMCTVTAIVILTSDVYHLNPAGNVNSLSGTALTSEAFQSVLPFGGQFIAISILLFAFSTLISWSYYGERAVEYLFGLKAVLIYKLVFIFMISVGCTTSLDLVWEVSDTLNGLMAIPNLIAITLLSGQVIRLTKDYRLRHKND